MQFKKNKKQEGIILMITSFNQLHNFLSFFLEKKLIKKKNKIYLIILSDHIPRYLILEFKQFIEKFASTEVVYLRRKFIKRKKNFFKSFFYYLFFFKKIFQMKKSLITPSISVYGKIQFPILFIIFYFSSSKIFLIEDGIFEYVPYSKNEKIPLLINILKKFLMINKSRIHVLQLAKKKTDYKRLLKLPFLKKDFFFDNREVYKNFIRSNFEKKLLFKPKCILIGENPLPSQFNYVNNLYIKTLIQLMKKYSCSAKQILFFPHPRTELFYRDLFEKSLSKYSNIHPKSTLVAENYYSQDNLEIIVGTTSSALFYAKTVFNKNQVYYLENEFKMKKDYEVEKNYLNVIKSTGIKKFIF